MANEKEMFLKNFQKEYAITKRILQAYPNDKLDFKPSKKSRSARDLAALFASETSTIPILISTMKLDPSAMRKINDKTVKDIVSEYEKSYKDAVAVIKKTPEENFAKNVDFFGMKMRLAEGLWSFVTDQIHHRGQFSVYLRLVDAKVPPIYGPTADYPKGEADFK